MNLLDICGDRIEIGDVVRLPDSPDHSCCGLVELAKDDGWISVRRFDRRAQLWHKTRQKWPAPAVRRDPFRGGRLDGQRNSLAFVERLREW